MLKKLICCILVLFPLLCFGSSIHIIPVLLEMEIGQKNSSFKISNDSKTPMLFQIKVVKWTQEKGEEVQSETKDILINPSVVSIDPGTEQLVRIGLRTPLNPEKQHAYRVILTQVPVKTDESKSFGVSTVMRFTLPLFIPPKKEVQDISLRAEALPDGHLKFHMANKGNTAIKLTKIDFVQNGESLASDEILAYLFPGQEKSWSLMSKKPKDNKDVVLKLTTDRGVMEAAVNP